MVAGKVELVRLLCVFLSDLSFQEHQSILHTNTVHSKSFEFWILNFEFWILNFKFHDFEFQKISKKSLSRFPVSGFLFSKFSDFFWKRLLSSSVSPSSVFCLLLSYPMPSIEEDVEFWCDFLDFRFWIGLFSFFRFKITSLVQLSWKMPSGNAMKRWMAI